jgi:sRNA-binding protein
VHAEPAPLPPPVATAYTLEILAPLVLRLPDWIAVFPREVGDPILPLPTGARAALAVLLPAGDRQALADLNGALDYYTRSYQYLAALKVPGACRYSLTGQPNAPAKNDQSRWNRIDREARRALSRAPKPRPAP